MLKIIKPEHKEQKKENVKNKVNFKIETTVRNEMHRFKLNVMLIDGSSNEIIWNKQVNCENDLTLEKQEVLAVIINAELILAITHFLEK